MGANDRSPAIKDKTGKFTDRFSAELSQKVRDRQSRGSHEFIESSEHMPRLSDDIDDVRQRSASFGTKSKKQRPVSAARSSEHVMSVGTGGEEESCQEQHYRVCCSYSQRKSGEVELTEGAIVDVLEKNLSGWWFVHVEGKDEQGWAPGAFLEPITQLHKDTDTNDFGYSSLDELHESKRKYRTVCDYAAQDSDEISYVKGEDVEVMCTSLDGWWKVRHEGRVGFTAATNLELVSDLEEKSEALYSEIGNSVGHQPSIYSKCPPPRRSVKKKKLSLPVEAAKQNIEALYAKVNKGFRKKTNSTEEINYDKVQRDAKSGKLKEKLAVPQMTVVQYEEIIVDENQNNGKKLLTRKDSPVEYSEIRPTELGLVIKDKGSRGKTAAHGSTKAVPHTGTKLKSVVSKKTVLPPGHNYLNVVPADKRQYENVAPGKLKPSWVGKLFVVSQNYTPHTAHTQGLKVVGGDTVQVQKEESDKCWCVLCPTSDQTTPLEGWLSKDILTPCDIEVTEKNRHSIPIMRLLEDQTDGMAPPLPAKSPEMRRKAKVMGKRERKVSAEKDTADLPTECQLSPSEIPSVASKFPLEGLKGKPAIASRAPKDPTKPSPPKHSSMNHENQPWFAGKMSRVDCEIFLQKYGNETEFLVRESTNRVGSFTISATYDGRIRHFPIELTSEEKYLIGNHNFSSLPSVIKYYQSHPLFYDGKQDPVSLGQPFSKDKLPKSIC